MIFDNNLICYEYYKNTYTPNQVRPSGAKDDEVLEDKYAFNKYSLAILILEEDIINKDGYGLKKGFYNVAVDDYLDFLFIIQSGKVKAKIPVGNIKVIETINPIQPKVEKKSYKKFQKEQEKEYRKYLAGQNPDDVNLKTAQIQRLDEQNSYILIYNTKTMEISGIIKF